MSDGVRNSTVIIQPADLATVSLGLVRALAALAEASIEQTAPGLTLQQFRALTILHEEGPQNASTLAAALGIAPSTLTRLGNRLVRDGLVDRVVDPTDRRAVLVSTTRTGDRTADRVKAWRLAELERHFADVTPGESGPLFTALEVCARLFGVRGSR